jgi:hypothetical protein
MSDGILDLRYKKLGMADFLRIVILHTQSWTPNLIM